MVRFGCTILIKKHRRLGGLYVSMTFWMQLTALFGNIRRVIISLCVDLLYTYALIMYRQRHSYRAPRVWMKGNALRCGIVATTALIPSGYLQAASAKCTWTLTPNSIDASCRSTSRVSASGSVSPSAIKHLKWANSNSSAGVRVNCKCQCARQGRRYVWG